MASSWKQTKSHTWPHGMGGCGLRYAIGSKASVEYPEQSGIIPRNDVSASGIVEPDLKHIGAHDKLREADQK